MQLADHGLVLGELLKPRHDFHLLSRVPDDGCKFNYTRSKKVQSNSCYSATIAEINQTTLNNYPTEAVKELRESAAIQWTKASTSPKYDYKFVVDNKGEFELMH